VYGLIIENLNASEYHKNEERSEPNESNLNVWWTETRHIRYFKTGWNLLSLAQG
jgi:hypothetical protein